MTRLFESSVRDEIVRNADEQQLHAWKESDDKTGLKQAAAFELIRRENEILESRHVEALEAAKIAREEAKKSHMQADKSIIAACISAVAAAASAVIAGISLWEGWN
jgi:hypothetical protein